MKRLFKVVDSMNRPDTKDGEVRYYDNKHSAKVRRNQLNKERRKGHMVRRGPDHNRGTT
jgi:hypothetical protein